MPDYYILKKVECKDCEGNKIEMKPVFYMTDDGGETDYEACDCSHCEGKGWTLEPVEYEEAMKEIREMKQAEEREANRW